MTQPPKQRQPARALSQEQEAVLEVLHSERFVDQSPATPGPRRTSRIWVGRMQNVHCETSSLALLGAHPPEIDAQDLAELPDLGSSFNDRLTWQALLAGLPAGLEVAQPATR